MGGIASGITAGVGGLIAANNLPKNSYNASLPAIQQQDLTSQISALTPQQQALTQQLQLQSQGQGPSPAQAMLNQATSKNTQLAAGQIASQRGISPALAARLGAQQGAQNNQTAAGQAATMAAQQQISSQGLLSQNLGQQQSTLQQAQANQNSAITQGTLGSENINAGISSQNNQNSVNATAGALQGFGSALSGGGGSSGGAASMASLFAYKGGKIPHFDLGGGIPSWQSLAGSNPFLPPAQASGPSPFTTPVAPTSTSNVGSTVTTPAGVNPTPGPSSPVGRSADIHMSSPIDPTDPSDSITQGDKVYSYKGGKMPHFDQGGEMSPYEQFAQALHNTFSKPAPTPTPAPSNVDKYAKIRHQNLVNAGEAPGVSNEAHGGPVPGVDAMVSPGEGYIPPHLVQKARQGNPLKYAQQFPGTPKRKGDHAENDTLPVKLEPGGVVIKNSVMQAKNPAQKAAAFLEEVKKQKKAKGGEIDGPQEFNKVLEVKKHLKASHEALMKAHKAIKKIS